MPHRKAWALSRRFIRFVGRRGYSFGMLGLIALAIGTASQADPPTQQAQINATLLTQTLPLEFWYKAFTLVGIMCAVSTVVKRLVPVSAGLFFAVFGYVGITHILAQFIVPNAHRALVAGVLYGGLAAWMLIIAGWSEGTPTHE